MKNVYYILKILIIIKCFEFVKMIEAYNLFQNTKSSNNLHIDGDDLVTVIPDEQKLISNLLVQYDPAARPVFNASKPVVIKFSLALIQISDMVNKILKSI